MSRNNRKRASPDVSDQLEPRRLLAVPHASAMWADSLQSVPALWVHDDRRDVFRDVKLRGSIKIDVVNPFPIADVSPTTPVEPSTPVKSSRTASSTTGASRRLVSSSHVTLGRIDGQRLR